MPPEPGEPTTRVFTIPNGLSVIRLAGVPLFVWLLLGPHADGWALLVLVVSGITDYADGKIARKFGQTSQLGTVLDPVADRLYIFATLVAFVLRDIVPLWLVLILVGRDVVLTGGFGLLRRHGYGTPPVHYVGKAATFALLYAFPLLLIDTGHGTLSDIVNPVAWAFTIWGTALYMWAGVLYVVQINQLLRIDPPNSLTDGNVVNSASR